MIRRPPRSTQSRSSAASDVYKRQVYRDYKWRYVVLALYFLASLTSGLLWISFAPLTNTLKRLYGISSYELNTLTLLYNGLYFPASFVANWAIDQKSLKFAVVTGVGLTAVGSCLRALVNFTGFYIVITGQIFAAFAQPFLLNGVTKLTVDWFIPQQRAFATSVGFNGNQIGIVLGYYTPFLFINDNASTSIEDLKQQINYLVLFQLAVIAFVFILTVCLFKSKPKSPPAPAATRRHEDYIKTLKDSMKNRNYLLFGTGYALNLATYIALSTNLNAVMTPFDFEDHNSGEAGSILNFVAIAGQLIIGCAVSSPKNFRLLILLVFILAAGTQGFMGVVLAANDTRLLYGFAILLGLAYCSVWPMCAEFACEVNYPHGEGATLGLMGSFGNIIGIVLTLISTKILEDGTRDSANSAIFFFTWTLALGSILVLLTSNKTNRSDAEALMP
eukprot:TRINITY_DN9753_c0_g3_i2.p1 TRINITY_DN9753_c0_g3~~TRINITY_DN9753_c0_g3_i2.p1  ORF type:complete len:446 (+),score=62.39 TRINITY_DN9753_c0_g3_i2:30-1367(+)